MLKQKPLLTEQFDKPDFHFLESDRKKLPNGVLLAMEGQFGSYDVANYNDREYPKVLWEGVIHNTEIQNKLNEKGLLGEADHPEILETSMTRVSHCIRKLWLEDDGRVMGRLDVLDTPAGRIVDTLARYGAQIGISSRGAGDIKMMEGRSVVDPDTYEYITHDLVIDPACEGSYPQMVMESIARADLDESNVKDDFEFYTQLFKKLGVNLTQLNEERIRKGTELKEKKSIKKVNEQGEHSEFDIESRWNKLCAEAEEKNEIGFMSPHLYQGAYWTLDGNEGMVLFPTDDFPTEEGAREQYSGEVYEVEQNTGYYARLSASGYMDQTDYTPINDVSDVDDFFQMYVWMESIYKKTSSSTFLQKQVTTLSNGIVDLNKQLEEQQVERDKFTTLITVLENTRNVVQDRCNDLTHENQKIKKERKELKGSFTSLQKELERKTTIMRTRLVRSKKEKKDLTDLKVKLEKVSTRTKKLQTKLKESRHKLQKLQTQQESSQNRDEKEIQEAKNEAVKAKNGLRLLHAETEKLRTTVTTLRIEKSLIEASVTRKVLQPFMESRHIEWNEAGVQQGIALYRDKNKRPVFNEGAPVKIREDSSTASIDHDRFKAVLNRFN